MKKFSRYIVLLFTAVLTLTAMSHAQAEDRATNVEAIAFVKKAVAYYNKNGRDIAFAAFADATNKEFHDRDLYIFVYDLKGVCLAHGNNPKMVGKDLFEMKDANGKTIIKDFIEVAKTKGSGWVEYSWPNPVTKNLELKSSYVTKVDEVLIGAGIYKGHSN